MLLKSGVFLLLCMICPLCVGTLLTEKEDGYMKKWIWGWMLLFAVFEVLAIAATLAELSADTLNLMFGGVTAGCLLAAWRLKKLVFSPVGKKNPPAGDKSHSGKDGSWSAGENVLAAAALLLIAVQVLTVVCTAHIDNDDAFYVGTAVTTYFTNSVNQISPYTGEFVDLTVLREYALSPYPILWGCLGKLFQIHPTYLMHTLLPIIFIPMVYMVLYLIGREVFPQDRKRQLLFLLFAALLNLFGGFSTRSPSSFLLFRIWQGKAMLCNIMVPMYYYLFLEKETKADGRYRYVKWWILALAACLVCFSSVMILPVLLGIFVLSDLVCREKLKDIIRMGSTMTPYLILGVGYVILCRG